MTRLLTIAIIWLGVFGYSNTACAERYTLTVYLPNHLTPNVSEFRRDYQNGLGQTLYDDGVDVEFIVERLNQQLAMDEYPRFRLLGGMLKGYQQQHFLNVVRNRITNYEYDPPVTLESAPKPRYSDPMEEPCVAPKPEVIEVGLRTPYCPTCPTPNRPQPIYVKPTIDYNYIIQQVLLRIPKPQHGQPGPGYDAARIHNGHLWLHIKGDGWVDLGKVESDPVTINLDDLANEVAAILKDWMWTKEQLIALIQEHANAGLTQTQIIALIKHELEGLDLGGLTEEQIIVLIKQHGGGLTKEEIIVLIQYYISQIDNPDVTPPPDADLKKTHIVLVADQTAEYWPRLRGEFNRAKGVFSAMKLADPPDFTVQLPQLVVYKDGTPHRQIVGLRDVSDTLNRMSRGDFDL